MKDFLIHNEGTIIMFTPLTDAAEGFLSRCDAERWQYIGLSLCVDHRPARDLLQAITAEGLTYEA